MWNIIQLYVELINHVFACHLSWDISFFISFVSVRPQMRRLNTSARCIILIFILIDVQSIIGDPLKILNFTYRTKQFEILELTIANNIITLDVDQDLYHQVQCPIEFSDVTQTQFVPCCSNSSTNTPSGCYKPERSDESCIDQNHATFTGIMQADDILLQRYAFQIANYQNCHSISILAKALSGNIILNNVKSGNVMICSRSNF